MKQMELFTPTSSAVRELFCKATADFTAGHQLLLPSHCIANLRMFGIRGFVGRLCAAYSKSFYRPAYLEPTTNLEAAP